MKTNVYIDGFNFYYGCFKHSSQYGSCKWLNLRSLCEAVLVNDVVQRIHYFTAKAAAPPWDQGQPRRQGVYLRALSTLDDFEIHFGKFQKRSRTGVLVDPPPGWARPKTVIKTWEEKGSDVNLATKLLVDAFDGVFEKAVIISNDSDLSEAIAVVRTKFNLDVEVISPQDTVGNTLAHAAGSVASILDKSLLPLHQFPDPMTDRNGVQITKPTTW